MPAIKATKELSAKDFKSIQSHLKALSCPQVSKTLMAILFNWGIIICLMALVISFFNVWTVLLAFFLIPTRQHALLVLMHDAAHYRLAKSKTTNDLLSNLFCSFPHFIATQAYRINHLAHHHNFNTEKDPDWERKRNDPRWQFPKSHWNVLHDFFQDILGKGIFFSFKIVTEVSHRQRHEIKNDVSKKELKWLQILYYSMLAIGLTYFNLWLVFFGLWILPFLLIFPAIFRIRSMGEHFGLDSSAGFDNEFTMSRNFSGPCWERIIFSPHNVAYHLDHHLFPSVPWFNLPELHMHLEALDSYRIHMRRDESLFGGKGHAAMKDFANPRYAVPAEKL